MWKIIKTIGKCVLLFITLMTLAMVGENKFASEKYDGSIKLSFSKLNSAEHDLGTELINFTRSQRSFKSLIVNKEMLKITDTDKKPKSLKMLTNLTSLDGIVLYVKTSFKFHKTRLKLLLDTWINTAQNQTYLFTDEDDNELKTSVPANHVINTNCTADHSRIGLVCKMGHEFDWFIWSKKRWFCHVDDDTYVNVNQLVNLLQKYNHLSDWYLGKPSLRHPKEVTVRTKPEKKVAFWFGTGGAGFCISRSLALKMMPYAGGGRLMEVAEQIRLSDDCSIGYIINSLLGVELTVIEKFHSHLEELWPISTVDVKDQITFSYKIEPKNNIVNVTGLTQQKDPTRFWSIHCHINPLNKICLSLTNLTATQPL